MSIKSLQFLFSPSTIAVKGFDPSGESDCPARTVIKNLLATDFNGAIIPITKDFTTVSGLITYPTFKKTPRSVDLAVLAGPLATVPNDLEECGKAKIKGALILGQDFRHRIADPQGFIAKIKGISKKYGIRCLGPNSVGFARPKLSLHVSTTTPGLKPGRLAFISQSATFASAILEYAIGKHIGFSTFVSMGAQADIHLGDVLDFLAMDPDTKAVVMYVERIMDGRGFVSAAKALARIKPIIVVKGGRFASPQGNTLQDTVISEDSVYDAVFQRTGIVRVEDALELFHVTEALSKQPPPKGNSLIIITNAGGPAIMATDTLFKNGGTLARLTGETEESLNAVLPKYWHKGNPIDCLSDANPSRIRRVLEIVLDQGEIDGILVILTPQNSTKPLETARHLVEASKKGNTPHPQILACWMGSGEMERARAYLNENDIPTFVTPEQAVKSFIYTFRHSYNLALQQETPASILEDFMPDLHSVETLLNKVLSQDRHVLSEYESKMILRAYGIESAPLVLAKDEAQIEHALKTMKGPFAVKVDSPDIKYKARDGLVRLHIPKREVKKTLREIVEVAREKYPNARLNGITLQSMVYRPGQELAIGAKKNNTFGTVIYFGTGGKLFDTLQDYAIGLPPLNQTLARRLMEQTKVFDFLSTKAIPKPDLKIMEMTLMRLSQLVTDFPQIHEVEINPFFLDESMGVCLDARITLEKETGSLVKSASGPFCPSNLVICPYPCHFIDEAVLKDGTAILIRPIKPEDEPKMYELFHTFSPETIRMRFFHPIAEIPHETMVRYCQIDYDREIALVALITEENRERFIGVGRLTILPDRETSEFSVVVGDPWQKKGTGTILTRKCLEIAKTQGINEVYMDILDENSPMKHMAKRFGFEKLPTAEEGLVRFKIDLRQK